MTLGFLRPVVLLPVEWLEWSTEKLEAVLLHEGTHIERGDSAIAFLTELNLAVNWFNPLSWWLRQQLSTLAEEACDDAAIAGIGDRTTYARHLLEVAAAVSSTGRIVPAGVSMARQSNVESRIDAILDFTRPLSQRPTWATSVAILLLSGPLITLAAVLKPGVAPQSPPRTEFDRQPATADSSQAATTIAQAGPVSAPIVEPTEAAQSVPAKASRADAANQEILRYAGKVADADGLPVEGARVSLVYWRFMEDKAEWAPVTTDAAGRFELTRQRSDFNDSPDETMWMYIQIVATKPGHGFTAASSVLFETSGSMFRELSEKDRALLSREEAGKDRVLKLGVDLPIRGRIVDIEGRPVVGAVIAPFNADEGTSGSLDQWEAATKNRGANFYSVRKELRRLYGGDVVNGPIDRTLAPVTTDADGVFFLAGVGRERIVSAVLSGPNIESSILRLRSRPGETIKLADNDHGEERFYTYYPAEFTHIAGPSQPVEGIVTDLRTGNPIEGVFVRGERTATYNVGGFAGFIRSTTDQRGRFRLEGFPLGSNQFVVLPPARSGYLAAGVSVHTRVGTEPLVNNIALTPAIRARGVVKEAGSGKPILGYAEYFAFANNPALAVTGNYQNLDLRLQFRTDSEGQFEIPVLPGPGVITFSATNSEMYPRGDGADQISGPRADTGTLKIGTYKTLPYFLTPINYHGLIPIDPPDGGETIDVALTLTPLQSFSGRVLAEDGRPIEKYILFGERAPADWYERTFPDFEVKGYRPGIGRRLMAYVPDSNTIGLLDVTGDKPSIAEIKLQPAARFVGRIVDADGEPISGVRIDNDAWGGLGSSPISREEHWAGKFDPERGEFVNVPGHPLVTDAEGRFELVGVMPGLKYSARAFGPRRMDNETQVTFLGSIFSDVVANSGGTHDLGDVRIISPRPRMSSAPQGTPQSEQPAKERGTSASGTSPGGTP
jgi:protocatechuate 3,4-dioxygenase beta subunit